MIFVHISYILRNEGVKLADLHSSCSYTWEKCVKNSTRLHELHQHFDFCTSSFQIKTTRRRTQKQGNIPRSSSTKGSNSNIPLVPLTPLPRKRKAQQNQVNPSELTVQPSRRNGARAFHSRRQPNGVTWVAGRPFKWPEIDG